VGATRITEQIFLRDYISVDLKTSVLVREHKAIFCKQYSVAITPQNISASFLNAVSKYLILTAHINKKKCGPKLTAEWNIGDHCHARFTPNCSNAE
jgi:hypothetical protein